MKKDYLWAEMEGFEKQKNQQGMGAQEKRTEEISIGNLRGRKDKDTETDVE